MAFRHRKQPMIDSVYCDITGWELREQSDTHRLWLTSTDDPVMLRLCPIAPECPFDLTDLDGARTYYERQSADMNGVPVSIAIDKVHNLEVLCGVFKYRSPEPRSLAMYYVGILFLPFRDFFYQFQVESIERGMTGAREAVVEVATGKKPPAPKEQVFVKNMDELLEKFRNTPIRRLSPTMRNTIKCFQIIL